MIFACPSCSASHFKPDAEAKAGVNVSCRRCKVRFRVTAAGVEPLPPEEVAPAPTSSTDVVAQAIAAETTESKTEVAVFESGSTDVMKVPQGIASASAGGLADALEPETADADMIQSIDEVVSADVVAPTPAAMSTEHSTTAGAGSLQDEPTAGTGPSLADLGAASEALAYDGGPTMQAQPHALAVLPEMKTVVEPLVDAIAPPPEDAAPAPAPAPRSEVGAGTFAPAIVPDAPRKPKPRRPSVMSGYARDLMRSFSNATPARKAAMLGLPIGLLVLAIIVVALSGGPPPLHKQWVTSPASMWSGPAAQRGYAQIDTLVRGEEVVFLREVFGEYRLVRDVWGRVGYVNSESLSDERPPVTPESQFPSCRQAPIESDKEPCEMRARSLHDACGGTCAADGRCLERCQDRFTECIDGCKTRLTVAPAVAAAPDVAEPVEETPPEEGTETAIDKVAAEKPIKATKSTKTTRTTKKTTKKTDTKKRK